MFFLREEIKMTVRVMVHLKVSDSDLNGRTFLGTAQQAGFNPFPIGRGAQLFQVDVTSLEQIPVLAKMPRVKQVVFDHVVANCCREG